MKTRLLLSLILSGLLNTSWASQTPGALIDALLEPDAATRIVERGQDFAVFQRVTVTTNADGGATSVSNRFTLLENCLHYQEGGEWKLSEDVVEPLDTRAIARRGPNKTIFSSDLHSESVFDIQTATGERIRGGLRSIQLTDIASGRTIVLGTVKAVAPGEIVGPNQVVYKSAFEGIDADVLFVWRHNSISQNVILNQKPVLPINMDPATTRIEVITELVESPPPVVNTAVPRKPRNPDIPDEITIGFGSLLAVRGKAYSFPMAGVEAVDALVVTGGQVTSDNSGVCVVKQLHQLPDGRRFLIESVGWQQAEPLMTRMVAAAKIAVEDGQMAAARVWPKRIATTTRQKAMRVTREPYKSDGLLVDVDLSSGASSYTFLTDTTYYIASSFNVSPGTATFQAASVIKYGSNAYFFVHGQISGPSSGRVPVLTSKDDDIFGTAISGSTGSPTYMAAKALQVYYVQDASVEVRNLLIRWAKRGIEYDTDSPWGMTHYLRNSVFQNCQVGVYVDMPSGYLYLTNVSRCSVSTPTTVVSGDLYGSVTDDCARYFVYAASTARSDVLSAIEWATNVADKVIIPAGTSTWTAPITITNAIYLQGQGTNSTKLVNGTIAPSVGNETNILNIALDVQARVEIYGINFEDENKDNTSCAIGIGGPLFERIAIIHDCLFNGFEFGVKWSGAWGLMYSCHFLNMPNSLRVKGFQTVASLPVSNPPYGWDSTNYVVVEDCLFQVVNWAANYNGGNNFQEIYMGDTEYPANYIIRYCNFSLDGNGGAIDMDGFDQHGETSSSSPDNDIKLGPLIYKNTFTYTHTTTDPHKILDMRGGAYSLVYSNVVVNHGGSVGYRNDPASTGLTHDNYAWQNTDDRSDMTPYIFNYGNDNSGIALNTHYFLSAPAGFVQLAYPHPLRNP